MVGHGDGIPIRLARLERLAKAFKAADDAAVVGDAAIPGFSHFLDDGSGVLPPDLRFKVGGKLPTFAPKSQELLQRLMGRLAHRMSVPYEVQDNPRIPAGYTYLLQLVAHDLVQSSVSAALTGDPNGRMRNNRQYRLTLDTVYGAGPELHAFAYALDGAAAPSRTRLRLGQMKSPQSPCPFRDIGRVLPANQTGVALESGLTDVLIADARNDDNAILSQLLTLFHLLHNGMVAKISEFALKNDATEAIAAQSFQCAQAAVTLIYRNIIRNDLMEKVLHPTIYTAYKDLVDPNMLVHPPDGRLPLEFSHAAFRFGHAMIRDRYRINTPPERPGVPVRDQSLFRAMLVTSVRGAADMPLDAAWIVKWSNFFDVEGSTPNLSQRIRPTYSRGLLMEALFPPLGLTGQRGLASRELYSSAELGLWSVDHLINRLRCVDKLGIAAALEASPLSNDKALRTSRIARWLSQHRGSHTLRDEDIEALAEDPPLLFYILFEAWEDASPESRDNPEGGENVAPEDKGNIRGKHLGPLGSIIVAEVIVGALTDRLVYEEGNPPKLAASLKKLNDTFFDPKSNVFDDVPPLESMGQLVAYIAELTHLENAEPAFL